MIKEENWCKEATYIHVQKLTALTTLGNTA
jgi:hypothetical protein